MKRTFTLLFFVIVVLYAREGYNTWLSANEAKERITGMLSDIARDVVAIPLQPAAGQTIGEVRNIRKERNNLFVISEDVLYRYHKDGRFICRVTCPEEIKVAGYLVNPVEEELIVMGNADDIFYYTYNGELIEKKKLKSDIPNHRVLSMSLHKDRILSMEENCYVHPDTQEVFVEKEIVTYDTSFQKIHSYKLTTVDLGRDRPLMGLAQPQLCIDPDTGQVFVYSPSMEPEYLLQDTLFLAFSWERHLDAAWNERQVPVVPIRPLGRYWFSSYSACNNDLKEMDYTFLYDMRTHEHKTLKEGLKDDFYQTGTIGNLQAMDLFNESYCFSRSGDVMKKIFPEQGLSGNAVVFIVNMKKV